MNERNCHSVDPLIIQFDFINQNWNVKLYYIKTRSRNNLCWQLMKMFQVASRRVIQVEAVYMLLFGMLGKFGALFVTIPEPVIGGVFLVMFGKPNSCSCVLSLVRYNLLLDNGRLLAVHIFNIYWNVTICSRLVSSVLCTCGKLICRPIFICLSSTGI